MEHLPQTTGKGVLMFARRRQRIDEIAAEQEEMRSKGIPVEAPSPPSPKPPPHEDVPLVQQTGQIKQQLQYQEHQTPQHMFQQPNCGMNGLDSCQDSLGSKPLVANRTAKPFLTGLNQSPTQFSPVNAPSPTMKKSEHIYFKVPVPVNTSPQVWSPTGDIIASRDERIAVPAIKTVILPEMKRRGTNKANSQEPPDDDFFSLGAEACNFMQAPTIRHKHPPPVLPKPAINVSSPPWSAEDIVTHSAITPLSPLPALQNRAPPQPQPATKSWASPQPQPATKSWAPPHPQPATKSWASPHPQPMPQQSISDYLSTKPSGICQPSWFTEPRQTPSPASLSQPKVLRTKPQTDSGPVASCPPQRASSYVRPSKAPPISSISEIGSSDGTIIKGKGAELFARRQSRMEKFIVDAETVQANIGRPPSPTMSMPSTWKYSSIVRAPPPVSYNPTVSPFYPLAAQKQSLPAASSNQKATGDKEKPKTALKHLSVMDVMKHQPYQLDSSLFTYNSNPEAKGLSPKTSPVPPADSKRTLAYSPIHLQASSPVPSSGSVQSFQHGALSKPSGPVSVSYPSAYLSTPETCPAPQAFTGNTSAPCMTHLNQARALSNQSALLTRSNALLSTSSSSLPDMFSRSSLPMAPKPRFSAKKSDVGGKRWKPVVMLR